MARLLAEADMKVPAVLRRAAPGNVVDFKPVVLGQGKPLAENFRAAFARFTSLRDVVPPVVAPIQKPEKQPDLRDEFPDLSEIELNVLARKLFLQSFKPA